jgi:hypothetical protein
MGKMLDSKNYKFRRKQSETLRTKILSGHDRFSDFGKYTIEFIRILQFSILLQFFDLIPKRDQLQR